MKRCAEYQALLLCGGLLLSACSAPPLRGEAPARPAAAAAQAPPAAEAELAAAQPRFTAALQLMREGQRDAAIGALQALCRDYPQYSGPYTNLGILYSKMQRRDAAIASFTQALQRKPDNVVALNYLGGLYREAGDHPRAEQAYQQAQRVRSDYAPSYLNLAILYELSLHRPQQALLQYRLYQQYAGAQAQPMVAVWIKALETASTAAGDRVLAGALP